MHREKRHEEIYLLLTLQVVSAQAVTAGARTISFEKIIEKGPKQIALLKKIHKKRLLKLADFIETKVPSELLVMNRIMEVDRHGYYHRHASIECGTSGCAAAWATAAFKELWWDKWHNTIRVVGKPELGRGAFHTSLNYFFGTSNERIFGIAPRTPKQEAIAIRKFVEEN